MIGEFSSWPPRRVAAAAALLALAGAAAGFLAGQALESGGPAPTSAPLVGPGWRYFGIAHVDGPGSGALPLLPLGEDPQGRLVGEPTVPSPWTSNPRSGIDVLPWFTYCGRDDHPGLTRSWNRSDVLRYWWPPDRDGEVWYGDRHGDVVRPEQLPPGKPAYATWRTPEDADGKDVLVVSLLKAPAKGSQRLDTPSEFAHEGVMAWSTTNTHLCALAWTWPIPQDDSSTRYARPRLGSQPGFPNATPHLVVSTTHGGIWSPYQVTADRWTEVAYPQAGGGTTDLRGAN